MDTLIQKTFLEIMKINNFRGDLTDISAKKEALMRMLGTVHGIYKAQMGIPSETSAIVVLILIQRNRYSGPLL